MDAFPLPAGALMVGQEEREALRALRDRAALAPLHMPEIFELLKTPEGRAQHRERMTAQSVGIPTRYVVTFSIETGHPMGTARHMSMSTLADGRLPRPEAVWMVAAELGFVGRIEDCRVWIEDLSDGGKAVNIAQPVGLIGELARA